MRVSFANFNFAGIASEPELSFSGDILFCLLKMTHGSILWTLKLFSGLLVVVSSFSLPTKLKDIRESTEGYSKWKVGKSQQFCEKCYPTIWAYESPKKGTEPGARKG